MPTSLIADIFRMAENRNVTISFSYSDKWHSFKIEVRRDIFYVAKYFHSRDMTNETFIVNLISLMISEIDRKEKEKERKDP